MHGWRGRAPSSSGVTKSKGLVTAAITIRPRHAAPGRPKARSGSARRTNVPTCGVRDLRDFRQRSASCVPCEQRRIHARAMPARSKVAGSPRECATVVRESTKNRSSRLLAGINEASQSAASQRARRHRRVVMRHVVLEEHPRPAADRLAMFGARVFQRIRRTSRKPGRRSARDFAIVCVVDEGAGGFGTSAVAARTCPGRSRRRRADAERSS